MSLNQRIINLLNIIAAGNVIIATVVWIIIISCGEAIRHAGSICEDRLTGLSSGRLIYVTIVIVSSERINIRVATSSIYEAVPR